MSGLIVHEWLASSGGSEKVVEAMAEAFPDSDIRCLWDDSGTTYPSNSVQESWLGRTPLRGRKALAMPFMSPYWTNMKASKEYDWMLVSSHLFAHHAHLRAHPDVPKFSYIHTPARYIWTPDLDPRGDGLLARVSAPYFRRQDKAASRYAGRLAANSNFVRDRIRDCWDRDADVIYPPVQVRGLAGVDDWRAKLSPEETQQLSDLPATYLLGASRLVAYKRLDLVIKFGAMANLPVVIAGSGPEYLKLRSIAEDSPAPVHFVGAVSDSMLYALYQNTVALVFPAVEDFGIMPVEAMAVGTPVIGPTVGGLSETVVDGISGWQVEDFLDKAQVDVAVSRIASITRDSCRSHAQTFDADLFKTRLASWMDLRVAVDQEELGFDVKSN